MKIIDTFKNLKYLLKNFKFIFYFFWQGMLARQGKKAISNVSTFFLTKKTTAAFLSNRNLSFDLNETQREFQKVALQFAKEVILPQAKHYDQTGYFPWEIIKKAHGLGLMNPSIPEKYGIFWFKTELISSTTFEFLRGT